MKRVAIYARVSTDNGEQNPEVQLNALRHFVRTRDCFHPVKEYTDRISGSKSERPGLDQMLQDAEAGLFDAIAIVKLDRLARSTKHLLELAERFEEMDVDLIVKDQPVDTSTPVGRLIFSVLGAVAEFERDLIIERTKAGMAHAASRGVVMGRPRTAIDMTHVREVMARHDGNVTAAAGDLMIPRSTLRDALKRCA